MLKTLLKVGTISALLLGCYFGYVRAFDTIVRQFRAERPDEDLIFPNVSSKSKERAKELARRTVGANHWAVTSDLPFSYYNAERGFWMFAQDYKSIQEENGVRYDGKRLKLWPCLMIWTSADGRNAQVLESDRATLDMNQAIGLGNNKNSEGIKVKHAYIEGDVRIRDDKGTPTVPADDMRIGPLTYLEFDDDTQQITSESHVVIQDPDQTITGDGLVIQLRKPEVGEGPARSSSSGFRGVEYAVLLKSVRVALRDVGSSGMLPASGPQATRKTTAPAKAARVAANPTAKEPGAKEARSSSQDEPVPLFVKSEGPMRIDVPPDRKPVAVGPPEPPAPTLVRFERKVEAWRGVVDPDQLDCDVLRLTLVPGPQPDAQDRKDASSRKAAGKDKPAGPAQAARSDATAVVANTGPSAGASPSGDPQAGQSAGTGDGSAQDRETSGPPNKGLFGDLTLQKAHATGHAVWLQMRAQGTKVRCNEMIHERCMPYRPDYTLFRGDRSRQVYMEKVDYEPEEPTKQSEEDGGHLASSERPTTRAREVRSVTHVLTVSATIFDRGNGMDLADVRAEGPGRLETRPDQKQPVERIAIWQDELIIFNLVATDGTLQQKQVTLTGTRPVFEDVTRNTRLDSGRELKVFLKPRTPQAIPASTAAAQVVTDPHLASHEPVGSTGTDPGADATAGSGRGAAPGGVAGADTGATSGLGGSMQIERLLAYQDVHLVAPNRRMEAREWLDAPFIEVDPTPATEVSAAAKTEESAADSTAAEGQASTAPTEGSPKAEDPAKTPTTGAIASKDAQPETPAEPAMTGVADRIWAKIALPRGKGIDAGKPRRRKDKKTPKGAGEGSALAAADAPESGSSAPATESPGSKEAEAEVREAWLRGNVALHQDKPPDPNKKDQAKPQGNDIGGEAVYLENKGEGKASVRVYHRDPTNPIPLPGPIRWAKVSTDDMLVFGEILWLDQEKDKIWAFGPGTLNQWTDRAVLSDKTPESQPAAEGSATPPSAVIAGAPAAGAASSASTAKPRTRAGKPIGDKDLLTITWTKQMEFTGRTKDPSGNPAGRADFLGIVDAKMTDATLHCEQKMIVFTDREVPLKQFGSATGAKPGRAAGRGEGADLPDGGENAEREGADRSQVDISLIYCYGKPTAISRKVDPDLPIVLEQQRIDAWVEGKRSPNERLVYNRRTGGFFVPGAGMVFLYNRPEEKDQKGLNGEAPGNGVAARGGPRSANGRTVMPTSTRTPDRGAGRSAPTVRDATVTRGNAAPGTPAVRRTIQPLVLMQVKFSNGMKGRVGSGRANDTNQERWSEFYGNIEFLRSKVFDSALYHPNSQEVLSPDQRLSEDGFYLTSQMLRVIQEPPPVGSTDKAAAHNWAKAWDEVHINKGESISIDSDVATYDSATDVIWAYGEDEHGVTIVQQPGPGQQASVNHSKAFQYNLKARTGRDIGGDVINLIDKRTGARPTNQGMPDPTAQPKRKGKMPYKVPNTNLERRGFTGQ